MPQGDGRRSPAVPACPGIWGPGIAPKSNVAQIVVSSSLGAMLKPLVRSLVSAVVAACFAFIATASGAMPGCSGQAGVADHAQHGSPAQPGGHHHMPAGRQACVVHVCCAHLTVTAAATLGDEQVFALHAAPGFLPSANVPATPTPHALPFAQAPPAPIV
jgi:hypothetical protein